MATPSSITTTASQFRRGSASLLSMNDASIRELGPFLARRDAYGRLKQSF